MPSVLISSASRKVSLVGLFRQAAAAYGWSVIAGDCDPLAPSLYAADKAVRLPRINTPEYIPFLIDYAQSHEVRLIVPSIDWELLPLAEHANEFLEVGCQPLISSAGFVGICRDKWATAQSFSGSGVATPASWLPSALNGHPLPEQLFIKPRDGSASQNAYPATRESLFEVLPKVPNSIIQERLQGTEITIDALIDFSGAVLHYVPRVRIRTLAGESIQGRTMSDESLRPWLSACLEACAQMGGRGVLALQAFLTERGPVLTEVNPRFGGGFPLSYAAGAHYPEWILDLLQNRQVPPRLGQYTHDLYMSRYYQEHFFTADVLRESVAP